MASSIVTLEKPLPHIGLADWNARVWEQKQTADTRRNDAFSLRHESRQLRNETRIKTEWDTYHNNVRLNDRIIEIKRWKETLTRMKERVMGEIAMLKEEKASTERELEGLGVPIQTVGECLTIRDSRSGTELTYDEGDTELKKELCVTEGIKAMLTDRCMATWEKLNRLDDLKNKLEIDINDKYEAIEIDESQLKLDKYCANITLKPDPLQDNKNCVPYETWLDSCRHIKMLADNELADSYKLREELFVCRERGRNDLKSQQECTSFILRKRIFETQKSRNELQWQQLKMREEMDKVWKEIDTLQSALDEKLNALKLAETRIENRTFRRSYENACDEPAAGLKEEVVQLMQTTKNLTDKINCAKATYNALEELQVRIDNELANKEHALMTDIRCLNMRERLKAGEFSQLKDQTDRNLVLTRMEKEIPPT